MCAHHTYTHERHAHMCYYRTLRGIMKTLAILSRKGGTGKTTIAVHLAVATERAGHTTALIDLDPQASAVSWSDKREMDTPAVISAHSSRLPDLLKKADESGVDLAIIDTAAHAETSALAAARVATSALIPCRPASLDLIAIGATVDVVKLANVPAYVVLNGTPARGKLTDEARSAIEAYGVPCVPCSLGHRMGFVHALIDGLTVQETEPRSKASSEVRALYKYIAKEMEV